MLPIRTLRFHVELRDVRDSLTNRWEEDRWAQKMHKMYGEIQVLKRVKEGCGFANHATENGRKKPRMTPCIDFTFTFTLRCPKQ